MSLKPFIVYMSLMQSLMLLFLLNRLMEALYFHGGWVMVWVGIGCGLMMLFAFVRGVWDARRANAQETTPEPRYERMSLVNGSLFTLLIAFLLPKCWEVLQSPQVSPVLKSVYTLVTLVYCGAAIAHLRYTLRRYLQTRRAK